MSVRGATQHRRLPRIPLAAVAMLAVVGGVGYFGSGLLWNRGSTSAAEAQTNESESAPAALPDLFLAEPDVVYTVQEGDTFADVFEGYDVPYSEIVLLEQASKAVFDLTRIQVGKTVSFAFAPEGSPFRVSELEYQPDSNRLIEAEQNEAGWTVTEEPILYDIQQKQAAGTVDISLYNSALAAGIDEKVVVQLAEVFAWDIDFARDTKTGDTYRVLYEEKWRNGQLVTTGKILAAEYTNKGKAFRAYYFRKDDGTWGYYDADGRALQKAFLKAPVNFRYVSSGFTTARFHPILGKVMPHDGIDYAADYGVPIIAIGDGVVTKMGWNGGYGNRIEIRHNEQYGSQYSHMSAYVKGMKVGDRVRQGETVGYVGSTGYSTGNHVHFSMTEYGTYIDPSQVDAPDGDALDDAYLDSFGRQVSEWAVILDSLSV